MENPEIPSKKIKFSLDPLNELHSDVHDHIFQHLRGRDVRKLFMVSKEWSQITGNSTAAMSKIKLNFRERSYINPSGPDVTLLLKSQRKYLNMSISLRYASNFHRKLNLLTHLLPSLVEFTLDENENQQTIGLINDHFSVNLFLPNLKSLENFDNQSILPLRILEKANNLENLVLDLHEETEAIAEILCAKKKLKVFGSSLISSMVSHTLPIQFKLTSIKLDLFFLDDETSLNNFIQMVSETLEELEVHILGYQLAMKLHEFPMLKLLKFRVSTLNFPDDTVEPFKPNKTIEHLACNMTRDIPDEFLSSLKGVRTVSSYGIIKADGLKRILEFLPGVEKIQSSSLFSFDCDELEKVYIEVRQQVPSDVKAVEFKNGNTSRTFLHP